MGILISACIYTAYQHRYVSCEQSGPESIQPGARCALIWMHGLGDTEAGWTHLEEVINIDPSIGPCHMEFPRAPMARVSCNWGSSMTSWFDMTKLPLGAESKPPNYGCSLVEALENVKRIHKIVDTFVAAGIPASKIVIGGFSQGGAMALLSAMTYHQRLGGCIVFSGILLGSDQVKELTQPVQEGLPMLWCHGLQDPTLKPSLQKVGVQTLKSSGFKVETVEYPAGHGPHQKGYTSMIEFMNKVLA